MTIDFRTGIEKQLAREKMKNEFTVASAKLLVHEFNTLKTEESLKKFNEIIEKN